IEGTDDFAQEGVPAVGLRDDRVADDRPRRVIGEQLEGAARPCLPGRELFLDERLVAGFGLVPGLSHRFPPPAARGSRPCSRPEVPRTGGAGLDPCLDQLHEVLLRAGRGLAAGARTPGPPYEAVRLHVPANRQEVASSGPARILELPADLGPRLALPRHR